MGRKNSTGNRRIRVTREVYAMAQVAAQRASYEGCSYQLERLTARERPASQSSSELVEGTLCRFSGHLQTPPRGDGTPQPRPVVQRR